MGNLGRDPDYRNYSNASGVVTSFSLAIHERRKNEKGDDVDSVFWVKIVAFNKLGEFVANYAKKGATLFVEGRLQVRKYKDREGNEKISPEIIAHEVSIVSDGGKSQKPTSDDYYDNIPEAHNE
jgi:single-strand DNA-binding protein